MWDWLKRRRKRRSRLYPECLWTVAVSDDVITVTDAEGTSASLARKDISGVVIETNDTGPWGSDVWWLIYGPGEALACAFPQGAEGEIAAVNCLMSLPGFDCRQMIDAMASTRIALFPVWRKFD